MKAIGIVDCWMVSLISVASLGANTNDLQLVDAVKNQNKAAILALLKQHGDVNTPQADGATPLHWATHWDDLDTAELLIRAGANVNAADDLGVTPLSLACAERNAAMIEKLLNAGANPNAAVSTGETALMTCARTGSVPAVKALLAHGANVNANEPSHGQTALMWAAANQHAEIVRALLEHGADVHARSHVRRLLVNRGDPIGGGESVGDFEQGGFTPLLFAARQGDLDSAKLLLAAGANVNDSSPDGTTVLVIAAHSGHGTLAGFLLGKGADPNATGAGYSALHAAVLRGDLELVKTLLAHGASPNARLTKGTPVRRLSRDFSLPESLLGATPFLLAAKFTETAIMRAMAASGADPLLTLKDGTTPLMAAAGIGWAAQGDRRQRHVPVESAGPQEESSALEAVELTVELGGDVNASNEAGNTALHGAAPRGFTTVVQFLADRGAKLDVKNKRGQTALMATQAQARTNGGAELEFLAKTADLLRKLGAQR